MSSEYVFQVMVVDDENHISEIFEYYRMVLEKKHGYKITCEFVNEMSKFDPEKPYDLVMMDYNLGRNFSESNGLELIKKYRETNKIGKVIFYSSEFNPDKIGKIFSMKDFLLMINTLHIDKVLYRNDKSMMLEGILDCLDKMDVLPQLLSNQILLNIKNNIESTFTNENGEEIDVRYLLPEILRDSGTGREFKEKLTKTIVSTLFNHKY